MIKHYVEEAINLELNMSKLYAKFASIKDYKFWFTISLEEIRHADVLKHIAYASTTTEKDLSEDFSITQEDIDNLVIMNKKVGILIEGEIENEDIFEIALELESSASEAHFQKLTKKNSGSVIVKTFMKLSEDDADHYKRILQQSKINLI